MASPHRYAIGDHPGPAQVAFTPANPRLTLERPLLPLPAAMMLDVPASSLIGRSAELDRLSTRALAVARGLGATPLMDEIGSLAPLTPPDGPPLAERRGDTLTAREQEVLVLLAVGRTNREISHLLYISPKTASVHVSNIMAKLGARTRTEAAAIARRRGLIDQDS